MERTDWAIAEHAAALFRNATVLTRGDDSTMVAVVERLTAARVGIASVADKVVAAAMRAGAISAVVVGAARVAANGDARGVVGTYGLAIAASHHGVPFYLAVPRARVDDGLECDMEFELAETEVTPGHLTAGILTEYGLTRPPYYESIPDLATRPVLVNLGHD